MKRIQSSWFPRDHASGNSCLEPNPTNAIRLRQLWRDGNIGPKGVMRESRNLIVVTWDRSCYGLGQEIALKYLLGVDNGQPEVN